MIIRALVVSVICLTAGAAAATASPPYDLNSDGRQELVVGLPDWKAPSGLLGALVAPGSDARLVKRPMLLSRQQLDPQIPRYARAGSSVASHDFDGDGVSDLALGVPGYAPAPDDYRGGVLVMYGATEFPSARRQFIPGLGPDPEDHGTRFGQSLAAGDLNKDGYADLIVGATYDDPKNTNESFTPSGAVYLLFGGPDGLDPSRSRRIARAKRGFVQFGTTLAVGDVNNDGHLDLVEADAGFKAAEIARVRGHLSIALGGPNGPTRAVAVEHQFGAEEGPTSLAIGDVTGDGYKDVVAGVPDTEPGDSRKVKSVGGVLIWRGRRSGLADAPLHLDQSARGIPGSNEKFDQFGDTVAVARIDGDRFADIIVGIPGENEFAGRVAIIRGARKGWARRGHELLSSPERTEVFGGEVSLLDFDGDGRRDIAISDWPAKADAGAYTLFKGKRGGFSKRHPRRIELEKRGVDSSNGEAAALGRGGSS